MENIHLTTHRPNSMISKKITKKNIMVTINITNLRTVLFYILLTAKALAAMYYIIWFSSSTFVLQLFAVGFITGSSLIQARKDSTYLEYLDEEFVQDSQKSTASPLDNFALIFKIIAALLISAKAGDNLLELILLLAFEKSDYFPENSWMGRHIKRYPILSIITQLLLYSIILLSYSSVYYYPIYSFAYAPINYGLITLRRNGVKLLHYIFLLHIHGIPINQLWFIKERNDGEPLFTFKQVVGLIVIFFVTSLGWSLSLLRLLFRPRVFASMYFFHLLIGSFLARLIQPLREEIDNLAVIQYFKTHTELSNDGGELTEEQKLWISLITGLIFAMGHFDAYQMTSLFHSSSAKILMAGTFRSFIIIETYNISSSVILHTAHNICCDIFNTLRIYPINPYGILPARGMRCFIGTCAKLNLFTEFFLKEEDSDKNKFSPA